MKSDIKNRISGFSTEVKKLISTALNVSSDAFIISYLFNRDGIPPSRKTLTGFSASLIFEELKKNWF